MTSRPCHKQKASGARESPVPASTCLSWNIGMSLENSSFFNQCFDAYVSALDTMMKHNAFLRQKIFESSCGSTKYVAFTAAFDAATLENQAYLNEQLHAQDMMKLGRQREKERTLMEITLLRSRQSLPQETLQGSRSEHARVEALQERCAQLKAEKDHIQEKNDAILKECVGLWREKGPTVTAAEERKLRMEITTLKVLNSQLQEECEELISNLTHEDLEERQVRLKCQTDRIRRDNEEINDRCAEQRERALKQKRYEEECRRLEGEMETLKVQNGQLQEEHEELKSRLTQEDQEGLYVRLKNERDIEHKHLKVLKVDISKATRQLAQEMSWKKKCEAAELSRDAIKKELKTMKVILKNTKNNYGQQKSRNKEYRDQIKRIEALKSTRDKMQQDIDVMQKKILNLKAMSESHKHVRKEENDIKAINKKLEKKKLKLIKDLQKLKKPGEEIKKVTSESSKLRRENCSLYRQIVTLQDQIGKKRWLKAHLQTLKCEEKALLQRQGDLEKAISALDVEYKAGHVEDCVVENERQENIIKTLREKNDKLQSWQERLFVTNWTAES